MKYFFAACCVILLLSIGFISCSSKKEKAADKSLEYYQKAKSLYTKGDKANALTAVDSALALDSSNFDFKFLKGRILNGLGKYEQSIQILSSLLGKKQHADSVYYQLGSCYYNYGVQIEHKEGIETANWYYNKSTNYFDTAISINIKFYDAYITKHKALHNSYLFDDAMSVLNSAMQIFPDSISLICYRGVEKYFLGDKKGAQIDLDRSIESNKLDSNTKAEAYRFLGIISFDSKNYQEAIENCSKSLQYDSTDYSVYSLRGDCYINLKKTDKACKDYRKAADLGYMPAYGAIKKFCN